MGLSYFKIADSFLQSAWNRENKFILTSCHGIVAAGFSIEFLHGGLSLVYYWTIIWGAESNTATVAITVNNVKMIKQNLWNVKKLWEIENLTKVFSGFEKHLCYLLISDQTHKKKLFTLVNGRMKISFHKRKI